MAGACKTLQTRMIVRTFAAQCCAMLCRLMSNRLYSATTMDTLIRQAAVAEAESYYWEDRFSGLMASGLLRFAGVPGRDLGLRLASRSAGLGSQSLANLCRQIVSPAVRYGGHVCLDVSPLNAADSADWLPLLQEATAGAETVSLSLGLDASGMSPSQLATVAGDILAGSGKIAVRYPVPASGQQRSGWPELVRASHGDMRLLPVPVTAVRPLTPLHTSEKGQSVLPAGWFDTRPATAWLTLELDARHLKEPLKVRRQFAHCLRFADNLIDALDWPLPALRLDALLNRRVALRLTHIGDVLAAAGIKPALPGVFCRLQRWLQFMRNSFVHESMLLARRRGPFPELGAGELINSLAVRYGRVAARRLVRNRILRHRHLLALSPFSMFPSGSHPGAAADWIKLVPAIACADAISMAGPDVRTRLSRRDWERLLRLTAAIAAGGVRAGAADG